MARKKSFDDLDRALRRDDPLREVRQVFARMQIETQKILRQAGVDLDAMFRDERAKMEKLLRELGALGTQPPTPKRPGPRRRKPGGGSEAVTVEPNRPKLGEGGAAAALEFDE